jgi:hypothetical protein
MEAPVRDRLFIPLAILLAAAMIGGALTPLLQRPGAPVEGRADGAALLMEADDLAEVAGTEGFAVMPLPGRVPGQEGVRMAAEPRLDQNMPGEGARLLLGPEARARLKSGPVSVVMIARALPQTDTRETAVGLVAGGRVNWVRAQVGPDFAPVLFELPAPDGPPLALAFWPAVNGEGRGVEVKELRMYGAAP